MQTKLCFSRPFSRRMLILALLTGTIISLSVPLTYFVLSWNDEKEHALIYGRELAKSLQSSIKENHDHWQYDIPKYMDAYQYSKLTEGVRGIKVYDRELNLLSAETFSEPFLLDIAVPTKIMYNNQLYGYIKIIKTPRAVFIKTSLLFIIFSAFGLLIGTMLHRFPVGMVMRAEDEASLVLQKLIDARRKAERARRLASLGIMAAGIAHEINQPLNSLKIIVDGMLYWHEKGKTFEFREVVEELKGVSAQAERINQIIKRVHTFVRRENSTELAPCNLNRAVEDVLSMIGYQLSSQGIRVKKSLLNPLPPILGDICRLEEVLINLLVNAKQALDAVSKKDKEISITTGVEKDVILEISDNATGLNNNIKDKIFEPFFSAKETGGGMGLGLSIVHSIAASFNGQISVTNNDKGGATFRVEFPVFKSEESTEEVEK